VENEHSQHEHHHGEHDHAGHDHARGADQRSLTIVLVLTGTFMVVEVVGGLITGSLALIADAGHMLSDSASVALALFAFWLADRPATPKRSFGYKRAEILAALFNGATLVAIAVWIFIEAARRFFDPPEVLATPMIVVAAIGLLVNLVAAITLSRSSGESLNMQGALRHVLADLLGSVGAITAAVVILTTGWRYADPLISVLIGILVLFSSRKLIQDSINVLLEATPTGMDANEIGRKMVATEGVAEVHDLHVWTITSGFPALAAHVLVAEDEDCHARRRDLESILKKKFGITHTTLQVDHVGDHNPNGSLLSFTDRPTKAQDH